MNLNKNSIVGIVGAGAMGSGIAQVAATAGHQVKLFDVNEESLTKAQLGLKKVMNRLVEKGRVSQQEADQIQNRIAYAQSLEDFSNVDLVIEAIVENLSVKQKVFASLETIVGKSTVLATNTSSLSIASIGSILQDASRFIGIHFFNPAPLMPLVEVVPSMVTSNAVSDATFSLIQDWGKKVVIAKDTPGFIVNRVARPFYSEAIKMLEEGKASAATIDWAMREIGGFRMGPFELTDLIGHDVNYVVTETVWKEMFYDPRYRPSISQKRLTEAKWLGRKSGQGFYSYAEGAVRPSADENPVLGKEICDRILVLLFNEALDAQFLQIASAKDIDTAMTKGVNYPKGLLAWAQEVGYKNVLNQLEYLFDLYGDDRYRPSVLLKQLAKGDD